MESTKNVFKITLLLMFVLCIGLVSSVSPFTAEANQGTVIEIGFPVAETLKVNTSYTLHIHIFNGTINYLDNTTTDCYLHLYGNLGNHLYEERGNFSSNGLDFEWENIPPTIFSTLGLHSYILSCNNSETIGFARGGFDVTKTGRTLTIANTLTYFFSATLLFILMLCIVYMIQLLPSQDARDEEGMILQISQLKHLRSVFWIFVWLIVMAIVFIIGNFTLMFMISNMLGDIFMRIFLLMMIITIVGVPIRVIWIIDRMRKDAIESKLLARGVQPFQSEII